jgi:hypothetical protein
MQSSEIANKDAFESGSIRATLRFAAIVENPVEVFGESGIHSKPVFHYATSVS